MPFWSLYQNVPNPFNPSTVRRKQFVWDGRGMEGQPVATGIYLYRLSAEGFTQTKKMLLLK